ncbi:MAG: hypothetical protein AAF436_02295 [Myxococcota bacterium]
MRWALSWMAWALGSAAGLASACPTCASPLEENRQAFVDTTILLTLVPLAMIGGFVWWLRRKARSLEPPEIAVPETLLRDLSQFTKKP